MKSDLEIAQECTLKPILEITKKAGLEESEIEPYGFDKAKVRLSVLDRLKDKSNGKLIMVTGITPTPAGEGKTCTTIGLVQAMEKLGKKVMGTLRQPSTGPVFGIKGGAAGGGYSQVLPMEDINLGLTGDIHAVGLAHNLLSAMIDNHLCKKNSLNLDVNQITWTRVMDHNDRALRNIIVGLGGKSNGVPRQTGFDITAASEVMAILALASDLADLKERIGNIIIGRTKSKPLRFVKAKELKAHGAMAAIMKHAVKPTLVQTIEGVPVLIHAGPFANIAHGCNSVIADRMALKLADYVFTESGFGSDLGAEKFFNIKCRQSGLKPSATILVASVRALKMHGGAFKLKPGKKLDPELMAKENMPALEKGCENLTAHINNLKQYGIPVIVAVNHFPDDTDKELELVRQKAIESGATDAVISDAVAKGGDGAILLVEALLKALERPGEFKLLYSDDMSIKDKIETIAKKTYGAKGVKFSSDATKMIKRFEKAGLGNFPICMAKTHLSITDNPNLKGAPKDFIIAVDTIRPSTGAGFLYPICGNMMTMPGLPSKPSAEAIDIDANGKITGLF